MSAVLLVLGKLLLGVVAAIVLLFFVVLGLSLTVTVRQTDVLTVKAGVGALLFQIVPGKEKPAKEAPKEDVPKEEPNEEKEKKPSAMQAFVEALRTDAKEVDFSTMVSLVLEAIRDVFDPTGKLLHKVRIDRLELQLSVGAADAAQTALRYAECSAAFYNFLRVLQQRMTVKVRRVQIDANFLSGKIEGRYAFRVRIRIGAIVWCGITALYKLIKTRRKLKLAAADASPEKEGL